MEVSTLVGLIIGVVNIIPGAILVIFFKPIGSATSRLGKKLCQNQLLKLFLFEKLYEERISQKSILIIGLWLISWGIIAVFLFPLIIQTTR